MKRCPSCDTKLGFWDFAKPRLSESLTCRSCSAVLKFSGAIAFGIGLALLLTSYGVYTVIQGNFLEGLVLLPVGLIAIFAQYRFAKLSVEAGQQMR